MKINISQVSVMEFEVLAFVLQCRGWWIYLSCQGETVWIEMDKPAIEVSYIDASAITVR